MKITDEDSWLDYFVTCSGGALLGASLGQVISGEDPFGPGFWTYSVMVMAILTGAWATWSSRKRDAANKKEEP